MICFVHNSALWYIFLLILILKWLTRSIKWLRDNIIDLLIKACLFIHSRRERNGSFLLWLLLFTLSCRKDTILLLLLLILRRESYTLLNINLTLSTWKINIHLLDLTLGYFILLNSLSIFSWRYLTSWLFIPLQDGTNIITSQLMILWLVQITIRKRFIATWNFTLDRYFFVVVWYSWNCRFSTLIWITIIKSLRLLSTLV
jgi:hypothetical protein